MKYMGSKNRIAKYLLPIILENRKENQWYVEPFVGGANIIDKVGGNRYGCDSNKYLISMWQGLQKDRDKPYDISKELYNVARDVYNGKEKSFNHLMEMDDFMVGWIGWMASFNGRFFDGGYSGKSGIRNTLRQIYNLKDVVFRCYDYRKTRLPNNSIIYCDIPYKNTKQYTTSKGFNHIEFWQWCREKTKEGHDVYISEYIAPDDFECVWSKEVTNSMNTTKTYKPTEKLFKLNER